MIVTDLKYALENKLITKLDLMIKRCEQEHPKKDILLCFEGAEGEGKTNDSIACAYYIKLKTGRDIHLFFKLGNMIKFAQTSTKKIIIWDEPALDALSSDWYKETNKNLIRLLMVIRKNRHFFMFNLTKFFKFQEYIVVDRSIGMVHVYSRKEIIPGRFIYIKKKNLETLYTSYRFKKKRFYGKLKSFGGAFPEVLERYFDRMNINVENIPNATYKDYERLKNESMQSIGNEPKALRNKEAIQNIKFRIAKIKFPVNNKEELAKSMGISLKTLYNWSELYENARNFEDLKDCKE